MSCSRTTSRRALAVAISALVGLVGAVVVASPAHAHHTYVAGEASCPDPDTGEWTVTWTITSWEPGPRFGNVTHYSLEELQTGLEPDGSETLTVPDESKSVDEPFIVQQTLSADVEAVRVTRVSARWNNRNTSTDARVPEGGSKRVEKPAPCDTPEPVQVNTEPTCEGLAVTATNPEEGEQVEVLLTPTVGDPVAVLLAPGKSATHTFDAGEDGLSVTATVGDEKFARFDWERPGDCDRPDEPGEPEEPEESEEPGGGAGGDEELPLTGGQVGIALVGALLLLTLGAGLFLIARRRRITFTA